MEKPAETAYPLHDVIRRRWSPRAFSPQPVEKEKLGALLEAARWAASSRNEQPWRLLVADKTADATDTGAHAKLAACLTVGNQPWAPVAPVLILVSTFPKFAHNGANNPHAWYDCGLAIGNLTTQATASGLWLHQMAGFDAAKAKAAFALPEDWQPIAVLAIGYQGDPQELAEQRRTQELAPRTRKPLAEIAFNGTPTLGWQ
ncbi:MAG TPA: nitroreductase family protein [Planctomycetota bacterium]|nr:nitroreductase family protein [Planctomycetota bacterium]